MIKKVILLLFFLLEILFFVPSVSASTIFQDTFSGQPNQSFWTFPFAIPVSSSFGLQDNNLGIPNGLYNLVSNFPEPSNNIEKIEVKINTKPSTFSFVCRGNNNNKDFVIPIFLNTGLAAVDVFQNNAGQEYVGSFWDTTPGIHSFEIGCIGNTVTMKEDQKLIFSQVIPLTFLSELNQFIELDYKFGDSEFANYQLCDSSGCSLIQPQLSVPLVHQFDLPWAIQLYDSADQWSPQHATIDEWGCALTDAVMILQYYHITKLPDGTSLDPGTLNTWLKGQKDGYIGNGLVNWLAISRLTKQAKTQNPNFGFDALEYQRTNADKNQLIQDLTNKQPDILEEPGHFVVGTGQSGNTFLINDPAFFHTDLTQGYNNTFLSLGRYIPSHTDLSYIMVVTDPSLTVNLTDNNNVSTGSSYIQNPLSSDKTTGFTSESPVKIFTAPKPPTGDYHITISSNKTQSYTGTAYLYDDSGNVQNIPLSGVVDNSTPDTDSLHIDDTNSSNSATVKVVTGDTLLKDLKDEYALGQIKNPGYTPLLDLAKNIQKDAKKNRILAKAELGAFQIALIATKSFVSKDAYTLLLYDVTYLKSHL